ncbi:hypothetical protein [Kribbella sp. NPDC004875]|uniref:hypothetical protein n=1 Tax=Kribbella sp. NPDC004875 TaxID=3364107 RepID=UPI003694636D
MRSRGEVTWLVVAVVTRPTRRGTPTNLTPAPPYPSLKPTESWRSADTPYPES